MVWFPNILEDEAYEWLLDPAEGYFRVWDQLQREFLNEFRPKFNQNTTLRALINIRQGKEEEISAYIGRFDMVCTRYVGTLLNDDTLKRFFIQRFIKSSTIIYVLERNPHTLAEAKVAARKIKHIDRNYERLWRSEDELIPQLIPLQPRVEVEPVRSLNQAPYVSIESVPRPLAMRESVLLLQLPTPRVDPHLEDVENILGATQLGFQKTMIKQIQSLTDRMSLMIRIQQHGPPPQIESDKHLSGFCCVQCQQPSHTRQFCRNGQNRDQRMNGNPF